MFLSIVEFSRYGFYIGSVMARPIFRCWSTVSWWSAFCWCPINLDKLQRLHCDVTAVMVGIGVTIPKCPYFRLGESLWFYPIKGFSKNISGKRHVFWFSEPKTHRGSCTCSKTRKAILRVHSSPDPHPRPTVLQSRAKLVILLDKSMVSEILRLGKQGWLFRMFLCMFA